MVLKRETYLVLVSEMRAISFCCVSFGCLTFGFCLIVLVPFLFFVCFCFFFDTRSCKKSILLARSAQVVSNAMRRCHTIVTRFLLYVFAARWQDSNCLGQEIACIPPANDTATPCNYQVCMLGKDERAAGCDNGYRCGYFFYVEDDGGNQVRAKFLFFVDCRAV